MNTRDLFERLVADEPQLTISPSAATARGRRARIRRTAAVSAAAAAAVVLVTAGVVQLSRPSHTQPPGTHPTPGPTATRALGSTMPFTSTSQITASSARAFAAVTAAGAARGAVLRTSEPQLRAGAGGHENALVEGWMQYAFGSNSGIVTVLASAPSEYASRYAPSFSAAQGPCVERGGPQLVQCVRSPLQKGAVLWTYDEQVDKDLLTIGTVANPNGAAQVTIERQAVLVEADRSVLSLSFSLQRGQELGGSLAFMSLDRLKAMTAAELGGLAQATATAWQGSAPDAPAPIGVSAIPSSAPQATLGPPMASAFAPAPPSGQ